MATYWRPLWQYPNFRGFKKRETILVYFIKTKWRQHSQNSERRSIWDVPVRISRQQTAHTVSFVLQRLQFPARIYVKSIADAVSPPRLLWLIFLTACTIDLDHGSQEREGERKGRRRHKHTNKQSCPVISKASAARTTLFYSYLMREMATPISYFIFYYLLTLLLRNKIGGAKLLFPRVLASNIYEGKERFLKKKLC